MTQTTSEPTRGWTDRLRPTRVKTRVAIAALAALVLIAAVGVAAARLYSLRGSPRSTSSSSTKQVRYLGAYEPGAPGSYSGLDRLAHAIGRQPNIALYYGAWLSNFQVGFAASAAKHGAVPLVQMGTGNTSLQSIASGQFDSYWRSYADSVKEFGGRVILSLDHEMNGAWEKWGYKHASPTAFVAAWRRVVTIFREQGATNVTWLWTVNIIDPTGSVASGPSRWWPGSSYVNWVGIDGYYYGRSETFPSLFGPTIAEVRQLTNDPILIAETGAAASANQPAKIAELFKGVRIFGLLGFVLFDQNGVIESTQTWRLKSRAAYAALRQGAKTYMKPSSSTSP